MHDADFTNGNTLPHEVEIDLNVLGALMLNWITGHIDGADVVIVDQCSSTKRCVLLKKKLVQPSRLSDCISNDAILSFGTGSGYSTLTLGGLGDEVIAEEHCIARCGFASVRTTSPVSI